MKCFCLLVMLLSLTACGHDDNKQAAVDAYKANANAFHDKTVYEGSPEGKAENLKKLKGAI